MLQLMERTLARFRAELAGNLMLHAEVRRSEEER
jgi:hypothetical protein